MTMMIAPADANEFRQWVAKSIVSARKAAVNLIQKSPEIKHAESSIHLADGGDAQCSSLGSD